MIFYLIKYNKSIILFILYLIYFKGLSAPYLASDCVGALCRELKRHASSGEIRLLVALDQANSLYGEKTIIKKQNKQFVYIIII